jgi:hypothetical protein
MNQCFVWASYLVHHREGRTQSEVVDCSLLHCDTVNCLSTEDGGGKFLRNVDNHLQDYAASKPRKPTQRSSSEPCAPQLLHTLKDVCENGGPQRQRHEDETAERGII